MIIDDGREIDNAKDVVLKVGGVYKRSDRNNYYILYDNEEGYYNLINLETGVRYYDDVLKRDYIQEDLNNSFEYLPNAKLSF